MTAATQKKPRKVLSIELARRRAAKEAEGAWFHYRHGGSFLVRGGKHTDFLRKRELTIAQERATLGLAATDELPLDAANRAGARALFETVVAAWDDVADPWTEENFVALLTTDYFLGASIENFSLDREALWGSELSGLVLD